MADASHLERMGRELKCPICLSLLNSAVSLTCNHVFCNSCIEKSMKAASNCPVCKVPYRRREIRPAPHMDNLVSVYRSMEVTSGVNIFITQNAASTKIFGEDNQTRVDNREAQHSEKGHNVALGSCQKQRQGKKSKIASNTDQRSSQSNIVKPSFPTKKRVQVSPYPTSGTRMEPEKLECGNVEFDGRKFEKCQKNMSVACEKGESLFSPFFWLRDEEDLEKSTQQTDDNLLMCTPPDVPCFSDIKDSDDEVSCKRSPKRADGIIPDDLDIFDSEMFDWTQRPCSPELCSAPLAMQIEDTEEQDGTQEKAEAAPMETTICSKISSSNRKILGKKKRAKKLSMNKGPIRTSTRKGSNATEARKSKRAKKSMREATTTVIEPHVVAMQEVDTGNPSSLKRKPRKIKKIHSEAIIKDKSGPTLSDGTELLANSNKNADAHDSASKDVGKSRKVENNLQKSGERKCNKITLAQTEAYGDRVKTGRFTTGGDQLPTVKNNEGLILMSQLHAIWLPSGSEKQVSNKDIIKGYEDNSKKMPNSLRKVKFSLEDMSKDDCDGISLTTNAEYAMKGQTSQEIERAADKLGMRVPAKMDATISSLNGSVLLKCKKSPSTIRCAFCQSSDESEASGFMVHYLDGKPVAYNQKASAKTLHVHKNCAEWAPNVYFEDDNVINLESELSRSRRMTCSCCGIKGAALGCYEKSCRKSFHVPCARLTPECRWDSENFVMLCPLHASCQLPNEKPQSQSRQKRKSPGARKPCTPQMNTTEERISGSTLPWKSQKRFRSLVLCCSALTNMEKAIVTDFERLSGVAIQKNWESSVTHVIASTDENGACRRTLKFLMGVLEGKWILSVQWIKACIEAGELVDEQHYEISSDINGITDGPRLGRLRLLNKQPKLFEGYTFFFMGDFTPSYKGYLHDLVIAAGGKVLNRKPIPGNHATSIIVYSLELPDQHRPSERSSILNQRRAQAETLATSAGALVASNSWILNCIAGYRLQNIGQ